MGDQLIDALARQDDRLLPDTLKGLISQGLLKRGYGVAEVNTTIPGGWRPVRSSDVLIDVDGHLAVMARDLFEQLFRKTGKPA